MPETRLHFQKILAHESDIASLLWDNGLWLSCGKHRQPLQPYLATTQIWGTGLKEIIRSPLFLPKNNAGRLPAMDQPFNLSESINPAAGTGIYA
jgi:hypothetical protein